MPNVVPVRPAAHPGCGFGPDTTGRLRPVASFGVRQGQQKQKAGKTGTKPGVCSVKTLKRLILDT
ncbi:hypothetical protein AB833_08000 [Chromatiales bacterium (ex Bugula neritina AB1)]|nr:hypothetical protein AB833_08000 [Chromatiales bacterium (ex Bugula neritina AB1)]